MKWFRNRQQTSLRAPVRPSARPMVEALEDRNLLNASIAFDAFGNMSQVVVFNTGVAFLYTSTGSSIVGQGVRVAHVFRDAAGRIGLDIVYNTGVAFEFTSTGSRQIGTGNVLDVSTAFDARGNVQTDVLYTGGTTPGTGNLFEYTNTAATLLSTNATFATAFVDVNGNLGRAVGIINSPGNLFSFKQDSTGTKTLYNGSTGGDPVTDYDQSSPAGLVNTQATITAQTISIVTQGFGGCLQFGPGPGVVQAIGTDNVATA